jgi:NTP pyrophosphatase (non-canonical NTP hydrolase)
MGWGTQLMKSQVLRTFVFPKPMVSQTVSETLAAFVAEREWAQFHTPENLAKSVAIEAGELLECFQWGAEADPKRVRKELADVLTYCLLLADRIGVDPDQIVLEKLEITRKKYPVDKAQGSSKKYDAL